MYSRKLNSGNDRQFWNLSNEDSKLLWQFALSAHNTHGQCYFFMHQSTDVTTKSCRPFNPIAWWPSCFRFTLLQWNQHLSIFALSMHFIIACALVTLHSCIVKRDFIFRAMNEWQKKVIDAVNASKTQIQFILIIFFIVSSFLRQRDFVLSFLKCDYVVGKRWWCREHWNDFDWVKY